MHIFYDKVNFCVGKIVFFLTNFGFDLKLLTKLQIVADCSQ